MCTVVSAYPCMCCLIELLMLRQSCVLYFPNVEGAEPFAYFPFLALPFAISAASFKLESAEILHVSATPCRNIEERQAPLWESSGGGGWRRRGTRCAASWASPGLHVTSSIRSSPTSFSCDTRRTICGPVCRSLPARHRGWVGRTTSPEFTATCDGALPQLPAGKPGSTTTRTCEGGRWLTS